MVILYMCNKHYSKKECQIKRKCKKYDSYKIYDVNQTYVKYNRYYDDENCKKTKRVQDGPNTRYPGRTVTRTAYPVPVYPVEHEYECDYEY